MENAGMDYYCRDLIMSRLLDSGRDTRFSLRAYEFIFVVFSVLEKADRGLSGFSSREVVETSVKTASVLYGPMAEFVFANMGIKAASDIGAIISNLVDLEIFSRSGIDRSGEFLLLSEKPLFSKIQPKPLNIENLKIFEDT